MKRNVVRITTMSSCNTCGWIGTEEESYDHQAQNREHRVRIMMGHPTHMVGEHECYDGEFVYDNNMSAVLYAAGNGTCQNCDKYVSVVRYIE